MVLLSFMSEHPSKASVREFVSGSGTRVYQSFDQYGPVEGLAPDLVFASDTASREIAADPFGDKPLLLRYFNDARFTAAFAQLGQDYIDISAQYSLQDTVRSHAQRALLMAKSGFFARALSRLSWAESARITNLEQDIPAESPTMKLWALSHDVLVQSWEHAMKHLPLIYMKKGDEDWRLDGAPHHFALGRALYIYPFGGVIADGALREAYFEEFICNGIVSSDVVARTLPVFSHPNVTEFKKWLSYDLKTVTPLLSLTVCPPVYILDGSVVSEESPAHPNKVKQTADELMKRAQRTHTMNHPASDSGAD